MINIDKVVSELTRQKELADNNRATHILRVMEAIRWFNENAIDPNIYHFVGSVVNYKHSLCVCTTVNMTYPSADIELSPLDMSSDVGCGAGNAFLKQFNK